MGTFCIDIFSADANEDHQDVDSGEKDEMVWRSEVEAQLEDSQVDFRCCFHRLLYTVHLLSQDKIRHTINISKWHFLFFSFIPIQINSQFMNSIHDQLINKSLSMELTRWEKKGVDIYVIAYVNDNYQVQARWKDQLVMLCYVVLLCP